MGCSQVQASIAKQPACQWIVQLRERPAGLSDPADTPGQNLAEGPRKDPVGRNYMSGSAVRYEKQGNTLTYPSPQKHLHLYNGHEPRQRHLCRGNTSPSSAASLLRPGYNLRSNDGPEKTMGNGRQRETSTGPFVLHSNSFVGPDVKRNKCLLGSLDGATGLGRRWPGPDAAELQTWDSQERYPRGLGDDDTEPGRIRDPQADVPRHETVSASPQWSEADMQEAGRLRTQLGHFDLRMSWRHVAPHAQPSQGSDDWRTGLVTAVVPPDGLFFSLSLSLSLSLPLPPTPLVASSLVIWSFWLSYSSRLGPSGRVGCCGDSRPPRRRILHHVRRSRQSWTCQASLAPGI